jgi:nucleotide-binding universal stress UspA family protein
MDPCFLLATDLSSETVPHLRVAARLAAQCGARVTLFHAVLPRVPAVRAVMPPNQVVANDVAVARTRLQQLASELGAERPVEVDVVGARDARTATLAAADRVDAELIVLPTHGRSGFERAVLGSTAEQILRHSRRPVLLLTDRMLQVAAGDGGGPVVVATDLSPVAQAAHRPATALARRLDRPLLLLSVLPVREAPAYGGDAAAAPLPSDPQLRRREHAALLRQHAVGLHHDRPIEVLALVDDDIAGTIVRAAREQSAGLLVLATHGRRGIARLLKGSVAEQVVRHATVPVVCMPQPEA